MFGYRIELTPDDNGTFLVTCPALPEVTTFGATDEEIDAAALDAIQEAVAARIAHGEAIPLPDRIARIRFVKVPAWVALKIHLAVALRNSHINRAELQRRLGWAHREQVDRLFRLDHETKLDSLESAFHALHCDLNIEVSCQH